MDTRLKIIPFHEAREIQRKQAACWIRGFFDPLLAEHVRRLRDLAQPGQSLIIEVANSEHPLLPERARAELVAALSMVDWVVLAKGTGTADEPFDSDMTPRFIETVVGRHTGDEIG